MSAGPPLVVEDVRVAAPEPSFRICQPLHREDQMGEEMVEGRAEVAKIVLSITYQPTGRVGESLNKKTTCNMEKFPFFFFFLAWYLFHRVTL